MTPLSSPPLPEFDNHTKNSTKTIKLQTHSNLKLKHDQSRKSIHAHTFPNPSSLELASNDSPPLPDLNNHTENSTKTMNLQTNSNLNLNHDKARSTRSMTQINPCTNNPKP
ncbi:hypothetical protein KC19_VG064800 [Ceratodon purpureus]|uniref:Uncharacterized protein n=1 Tax=Ceratodon purpureus TaxID=3225 RepID=A0A8T0HMY1_CERPU|nr:hypothetical protein KC19_VG064800 [Ceratodon purpureus]